LFQLPFLVSEFDTSFAAVEQYEGWVQGKGKKEHRIFCLLPALL
jgi:hypothetical protein